MKVLIIGADGQLGRALKHKYPNAQLADINQLNIANKQQVESFNWKSIDTIINAAAYTDVDGAETDKGRKVAWSVNGMGPANLAQMAIKHGITLVHISTDYVFDGTISEHTEMENFSPICVYGQSKAAGDIAVGIVPKHYIVRTSWVVGEGKNFVRSMLDIGNNGTNPSVVSDQIGRLTFTDELVRGINHLLVSKAPFGTYNLSNSGTPTSWADLARAVFEDAGLDIQVIDTSTKKYFASKDGIAPRPLNSTLNLSKLEQAGFSSHGWRDDLALYVKRYMQKEVR